MAIEQKFSDLINADLDGEISAAEKNELQAFLDENAEGQALYDELASLCTTLEGVEQEEPPPYMRHIIMNSVPPTRPADESPGFLRVLLATPALKYSVTFAAGVFLTLSIVNSSQVSNSAFDNVTGLVGTVADPVRANLEDSIDVVGPEVAGTVSLRSAGSMLILDFDLVARDHIEIETEYTDRTIWFNGFAQLESEGTTVAAETGRVRLGMDGKRRYAVYLHNPGGRETTVNLKFLVDGEVLRTASLDYAPGD
ncbi:MAG: hypothetical protein WBM45_01440 [Woeseiaceae bacterium]